VSSPLDRPNHYFNDSLGDPATCSGDHNHLSPELTARAEEAANNARCARCQVVILEDSSKTGVVFGRLLVPILGVKHTYQLCGKCGLGLREFLFPGILDDPTYLAVKATLLGEHWT
jgi:hypothetical protein